MPERVKVVVYRWAGEKWGIHISGACEECDLTLAAVKDLLSAHPNWPLQLEIKPWLTHLGEALRHGGLHPPVVLVDGRLVGQGMAPSCEELEAAVESALARRDRGFLSTTSKSKKWRSFLKPPT